MMREKMKARFEMVGMLTVNKKIPTKIRELIASIYPVIWIGIAVYTIGECIVKLFEKKCD